MRRPATGGPSGGRDPGSVPSRGFALVAVLIVLGILMALIGPFLLGMSQELQSADQEAASREAELLAEGARDRLLARVGAGQGTLDATPGSDGLEEFPEGLERPEDVEGRSLLGSSRIQSGEVLDLQSRIHAPTAPLQVWGNLCGWWGVLERPLSAEDEDLIPVTNLEDFDERGWVWIGNELIEYTRKTPEGLSGLTRGCKSSGDGSEEDAPPDPYGPPAAHPEGSMVVDIRLRALVTGQFDREAGRIRDRFRPWSAIGDLASIETEEGKGIPKEKLTFLRRVLCFDSGRPHGRALGKSARVFNRLEAGTTWNLVVRDGASFPAGAVVRVRFRDFTEWALVVRHRPGGGRRTSADLGGSWILDLDRVLHLDAEEGEAIVEPLLPAPVNVNTAPREVLEAILAGTRARPGVALHGRTVVRTPLSPSTARTLAGRILAEREPDPDAPEGGGPFQGFEDLFRRVLRPAVEEDGLLSNPELFDLYATMVNGRQARLAQAGIPIVFESSGLVSFRAAGAVRSLSGRTMARREIRGTAFPQPSRVVDRVYATQVHFDEANRLDRGRPYWRSDPMNTTMRLGRASGEPPDMSPPHLMPFLHGKEARFPSPRAGESRIQLAIAQAPDFGPLNRVWSFETSSNPEGLDITREGLFGVNPLVPIPSNPKAGLLSTFLKILRSGRVELLPMALDDSARRGIGFGLSAWFKPETLSEAVLFDYSGTDPFRNRILVLINDQEISLRVYDAAGVDPDPGTTAPRENALRWTVPLQGNGIEARTWFHLAFEIWSGKPSGIALFTDGALKGKASFLGTLNADLPELDLAPLLQNSVRGGVRVPRDVVLPELKAAVSGVDLEDMPPEGVVRIGNELIEYTGISGTGLSLDPKDSRGGRAVRVDLLEWAYARNQGKRPSFPITSIPIYPHPAGASIELYGYANPLVRDGILLPGEGRLGSSSLERWGVARMTNNDDVISITSGSYSRKIGDGIDEKFRGSLTLAVPGLGGSGGTRLPGFDRNGGYALLIQRPYTFTDTRTNETTRVGGVEIIRYSGFDGSRLTLAERGIRELPPDLRAGRGTWFSDGPSRFVTKWEKGFFGSKVDPDKLPQLFTWVVPISVSIQGLALVDPSPREHPEWVQLRNPSAENDLEWIRYDHVRGDMILRTRRGAVRRLMQVLTRSTGRTSVRGDARSMVGPAPGSPLTFPTPPRSSRPEIGDPDPEEDGPSYLARLVFGFRGDPFTRTATHSHGGGSLVTPVFRTLLADDLERSLDLGRPGRGDRVALLKAGTSDPGAAEWNRVTWAVRLPSFRTNYRRGRGGAGGRGRGRRAQGPNLGPPGNLVALDRGAGIPLIGGPFRGETRLLDRIVKFPSGELPMHLSDKASLGASLQKDLPLFRGLLDDVQSHVGLRRFPISDGSRDQILGTLTAPVGPSDTSLSIRFGRGAPILADLGSGGLLLVGREVLGAVGEDRGGGRVQLSPSGRGLLGTTPASHDRGEPVYFLSCRPATFLTAQMKADTPGLLVQAPARLPRSTGTALIGQELVHWTWTRGNLLEMPVRVAASSEGGNAGQGLFRGRYGTTPAGHAQGDMVIHWPIRYWDRYAEQAEDPEMAWFGFGFEAPDVFLTEVTWEEEIPESMMDLELSVRVDERVPFSAPDGTFGLWRFRDPRRKDGRLGRRILAQGSLWDFRFGVRYLAGAFQPVLFNATAWKKSPAIKTFAFSYQAPTRIFRQEASR